MKIKIFLGLLTLFISTGCTRFTSRYGLAVKTLTICNIEVLNRADKKITSNLYSHSGNMIKTYLYTNEGHSI